MADFHPLNHKENNKLKKMLINIGKLEKSRGNKKGK